MQKPNVNEDYKFLEKHRLMLPKGQKINHISASLQPKVTFVREQGRKEHESNMITVAPSQYCMGGPLYWKLKGHWKSPITGSLLPLYAAPKPIEMPNFKVLSPIQGNPN